MRFDSFTLFCVELRFCAHVSSRRGRWLALYENAPEIQLYCVFCKFFDALCRTQMLQDERGGFCLCSGNSLLAPSGAAVVN